MKRLAVTVAVLVLALVGCTGGADTSSPGGGSATATGSSDTPDATQLLSDAAEATSSLETARFDLVVEGELPGVAISSAQGQLTRDGKVHGVAVLDSAGQPVENEFIVVGDTLWLKGPTGGFQELPLAAAATIYDPTKILDESAGLAALIAAAGEPTVDGTENIDGTETYRVKVNLPRDHVDVLLPGATDDLTGTLWISADEPRRPIKASADVPAADGAAGGTVTVTLSDFDAEANITPPN